MRPPQPRPVRRAGADAVLSLDPPVLGDEAAMHALPARRFTAKPLLVAALVGASTWAGASPAGVPPHHEQAAADLPIAVSSTSTSSSTTTTAAPPPTTAAPSTTAPRPTPTTATARRTSTPTTDPPVVLATV